MRKIIFIIALMAFAGSASSQTLNPFPTTDSLRKFINKWIRNSAVDAFTNLRLNTALIGMSRFLDSADAAGSAVTGFVALNDSTIRLTTNNLDTFYAVLPGRYFASNGLTKSNDTLYLGGELTKWTWIKSHTNRSDTPSEPTANAIVIGNEPTWEISNYGWLRVNDASTNHIDKSNLYLSRYYGPTDTVYKSYGGNMSATTYTEYNQVQPRYKNIATPIILPYGILSANHLLHPPDTAYWQTSPYGHTASIGADLRVGANRPYRLTIFSQSNISGPYPNTVYRGGVDLAHASSAVKRESYGNGYVSFVSDFRNQQGLVDGSTTEYGSYVSKIGGFYAYGSIPSFTASPSKAKTMAVSTADTVFGFWAAPQYTSLNETKNGYGYLAMGTEDDNYFAGRLRLGGSMPLHATVMRRFHNTGTSEFTDTVYMSKLLKLGFGTATPASGIFNIYMDTGFQVGYSQGNRVYTSISQYQNGITTANYNSKRTKGLYVEMDWEYSDPTINITDKFQRAILGYANIIADSVIDVNSANGGVGGNEFGLLYRKRTGYTDTTVFKGGPTPRTAPFGLRGRLDLTGTVLSNRHNIATGYHTALDAVVAWNPYHIINNAIWFSTGGVSSGGSNARIDTGYQIYMLPGDSGVVNKYALFQPGLLDTNYLAGPLRLPRLPIGGGSDSILVKTANGVVKTVAQSSISGASPALTTNYIGVGASSVLSGSSAYQYNGTSVLQENSGAIGAITSTTAVGASSGGVFNLYAKDLPTAANQVLGTINFGSRNGTTADNVGIRLRASTNGGWTDGSAEQAYFTVETNATGTLNEIMRWTANGRVGIGAVSNPTARVHIAAGFASAGGAPFKLTAGTNLTSFESGAIEFDGNNFYQSNTLGRGVLEKTRNQVISAGTFTIDGTASHYVFSGTTTTWTLPVAASSTNMTIYIKNRGSGNITLNSNAGGNDIYDTAAVNTITILPGASLLLSNDGTYFNVYHK